MFKIGSRVKIRKDFPLQITNLRKNLIYTIHNIIECFAKDSSSHSCAICPGKIKFKNIINRYCFGYHSNGFAIELINDKFKKRKERLCSI